ncbi:MAG: ADP-ribosylglycohydrolase family protein [Oscillospiraceae bacterium]
MMNKAYNKTLGALLAAAIGDAMGAPLASRTTELIRKDFGNGDFVYDYKDLLHDCVAFDMPKGAVTEGFSSAYVFAEHIVRNGGKVSDEIARKALFDWKDGENTKKYFDRYAGATTRKGVAIIESKYSGDEGRDHLLFECRTATCGAAMRGWTAGLFNRENPDAAAQDAVTIGYVSHDNPISLSAGSAVAAAVSAAYKENVKLGEILDVGMEYLKLYFEKTWKIGRPSSGASIIRRMEIAIETGIKYGNDFEKCMVEMNDCVGLGELASESIPSAFGFLTAAGGDVMKTIYLAINAGNNCDTIAMLAGAMAGAYKGADSIPSGHLKMLSEVNNMDIEGLAREITA